MPGGKHSNANGSLASDVEDDRHLTRARHSLWWHSIREHATLRIHDSQVMRPCQRPSVAGREMLEPGRVTGYACVSGNFHHHAFPLDAFSAMAARPNSL
nr:hypothetical protein CFP56_12110 [Quercus suber]